MCFGGDVLDESGDFFLYSDQGLDLGAGWFVCSPYTEISSIKCG